MFSGQSEATPFLKKPGFYPVSFFETLPFPEPTSLV